MERGATASISTTPLLEDATFDGDNKYLCTQDLVEVDHLRSLLLMGLVLEPPPIANVPLCVESVATMMALTTYLSNYHDSELHTLVS